MYIEFSRFHRKNYSRFSIGDDDVGKCWTGPVHLCKTNQPQVENIWRTPHAFSLPPKLHSMTTFWQNIGGTEVSNLLVSWSIWEPAWVYGNTDLFNIRDWTIHRSWYLWRPLEPILCGKWRMTIYVWNYFICLKFSLYCDAIKFHISSIWICLWAYIYWTPVSLYICIWVYVYWASLDWRVSKTKETVQVSPKVGSIPGSPCSSVGYAMVEGQWDSQMSYWAMALCSEAEAASVRPEKGLWSKRLRCLMMG